MVSNGEDEWSNWGEVENWVGEVGEVEGVGGEGARSVICLSLVSTEQHLGSTRLCKR